jgi:glycosyltransferase
MPTRQISIITPVYNNKEMIIDAISSLLNQTYKDIEYIIIDGASTDGTVNIVRSYGEEIDKFVSEPDKGIYDGLNKGVSLASGDVVAFLHSDDIYASESIIEDIVKVFDKNSAIDGVYGDLVYTQKNDFNKVLRYWKSKEFDINLLSQGWMPAHPTLFLKREVYKKYGKFDLDYKISADYDFMLRILSAGITVKYIPKVFYKMRIGGASNKSIKNIILKYKEDLNALKKNNVGGVYSLILKNLSKIPQFMGTSKYY